jgi:hypothetical protein
MGQLNNLPGVDRSSEEFAADGIRKKTHQKCLQEQHT